MKLNELVGCKLISTKARIEQEIVTGLFGGKELINKENRSFVAQEIEIINVTEGLCYYRSSLYSKDRVSCFPLSEFDDGNWEKSALDALTCFSQTSRPDVEAIERLATTGSHEGSKDFYHELMFIINRYNKEEVSGTPDFILANYMILCLGAYDDAIKTRTAWHNGNLLTNKEKYEKSKCEK